MRHKNRKPSAQANAELSARNAELLRIAISDDGSTEITHAPAAPEDDYGVSSLKDQLARMEQQADQQQTQSGFTPEEEAFLQQHPHLTQNMFALVHASQDAILHGLPRGTPEHLHFVKGKVEHLIKHHQNLAAIRQHSPDWQQTIAQQPQAEPQEPAQQFAQGGAVEALEPEPEPMPEPVRQAAPPPKPERRPSVTVQAPVSREVPSGSGRRESYENSRPTPMDIEGARINGITPEENMRQRLKLKQMRKDGEYRDNTG